MRPTYAMRSDDKESEVKLEGMHHVTMITADSQANVTFYADLLGLRLVKQTISFDAPGWSTPSSWGGR